MNLLFRRNSSLFTEFLLIALASGLLFTSGCVSIQYKKHYNRYFMPYKEQNIEETQPYNCLLVKGISGDPSNVLIYLDPRKNDPIFLIIHPTIALEDNDLYNLTKRGQPIFIPYQVCSEDSISHNNERKNVSAYSLRFLDAWAFDTSGKKVRIVDTKFWKRLTIDNDVDEVQAYLTIQDKPDSFLDTFRYLFTLSFGSKDTTTQIHLRFKPRIETLFEDRPKCKCEP